MKQLLLAILAAFAGAPCASAQAPATAEPPKPQAQREAGQLQTKSASQPTSRATAKEQGNSAGQVANEPASQPANQPVSQDALPPKSEAERQEELGRRPKSADPSDIRAMQSAQAMLKAEKNLRALIEQGKVKGVDKILGFEEIASWPYEEGLKGMPAKVKALDGKTVMMTGFMLPIDQVEKMQEFLLVQSLWSCCYGQPPDINGFVRVVMQEGKRVDYQYEPIKIVGKFKVSATTAEGYCVDVYQLHTDKIEVIK